MRGPTPAAPGQYAGPRTAVPAEFGAPPRPPPPPPRALAPAPAAAPPRAPAPRPATAASSSPAGAGGAGDTPAAGAYFQICWPVTASTANTPFGALKYM